MANLTDAEVTAKIDAMIKLREANVALRGAYYALPARYQFEHRTYTVQGGEQVRCRVERLTPKARPSQHISVNVPSGKYLITRDLRGRDVVVIISQHG